MFKSGMKKIGIFSQMAERDLIAIDLSGESLKLAQVKVSHGKKEITNLINRDIRNLSDNQLIELIKSLFKEMKIKKPPYLIDVIPASLAILKNIEIPSRDPQEIDEIVNLQAGRLTPYSRTEIVVDYINLGTYRQNYSKLLLIIVTRNTIKRHLDILEGTGIKVELIGLSSEASCHLLHKFLKFEPKEAISAFIHLDSYFTDFSIALEGKVMFIRSIPIGVVHLVAEREQAQNRFVEEVKKSLETYQSEDIDKSPTSLILTGATEGLKSLELLLNNTLHIPTKSLPYLEYFPLSSQAQQTASLLTARTSFLNVMSPLITLETVRLNLLPEEIKLHRSFEKRAKEVVKSGILVLSVFVLIYLIFIGRIYLKSTYLKILNSKYPPLEEEARKLEKDFDHIQLRKKYLSQRGYSLEVLSELYSAIPLEMRISEIKFDEEKRFSIKGTALTTAVVFSFIDKMEESVYFQDIKTRYTTKRKEGKRDVTDFEILCQVSEQGK